MEDKTPQMSEGGAAFELRRLQVLLIVVLMVMILLFVSEIYYFHQAINRLEKTVLDSVTSVPSILSKTKRRLDAIMKVEELRLKIEAMEKAGALGGDTPEESAAPSADPGSSETQKPPQAE